MLKLLAFVVVVGMGAAPACAAIVTQWTFNSVPPDNNSSTGSSQPTVGLGSAGLFGFTSFYFDTGAGSTDPAAIDNSAWYTRPYPAQGAGSGSAGVQFSVSTVGYRDILFTWDQRHASSASKFVQVQYSTNGSTFVDAPGGLFSASLGGEIWYVGRTVDLTSLANVDNNPSFAVRIVPIFAPGTQAYDASSVGFTYVQNAPLSYDMVTIVASPISEPERFVLMLAGLGVLRWVVLRKRAPGVQFEVGSRFGAAIEA